VDPASAMALLEAAEPNRKYEDFWIQVSAANSSRSGPATLSDRYSVYKPPSSRPSKYPVHLLLIVGGALLGFLLRPNSRSLLDVMSGPLRRAVASEPQAQPAHPRRSATPIDSKVFFRYP